MQTLAGSFQQGKKIAAISAAVNLVLHQKKTGRLEGFPGADPMEDVVTCKCDVLLPCARENTILADNAEFVQAKLIAEGANGPTTPEADAILEKKGVVVVPDILANAGGVIVSYFEWVQNRQGYYWDLDEIHSKLLMIVEREGKAIWDIAQHRSVSVRSAAYIHALGRLATAIEAHGTQPFFAG